MFLWKLVWRLIEINSLLASKFIEKMNYLFTIYESWMVVSGYFQIIDFLKRRILNILRYWKIFEFLIWLKNFEFFFYFVLVYVDQSSYKILVRFDR